MAIAITGGLFVATALTLIVVPALYALWFRVKKEEPIAQSPAAHEEFDPFDRSLEPARIAAE
jgi:hypothetical protein